MKEQKKIIRRNLPIDVKYTLKGSFYTGGKENLMLCENCGRAISNVAMVSSEAGTFSIGMDCAETLTSLSSSFEFSTAKAEFAELKALQAKINKERKTHKISSHIYNDGDIQILADGLPFIKKDISFAKRFLTAYLYAVDNPEKIGFSFIPIFSKEDFTSSCFDHVQANDGFPYLVEKEEYLVTLKQIEVESPNGQKTNKLWEATVNIADLSSGSVKEIGSKSYYMQHSTHGEVNVIIRDYLFTTFKNEDYD